MKKRKEEIREVTLIAMILDQQIEEMRAVASLCC